MKSKFNGRLLLVWSVLSALTLTYLWIDRSVADRAEPLRPSAVVTSGVIVIALVKVRIIFREFMEVRQAPALLTRLTDAWVLLMAAGMLGSYFAGMALA
ncbi:hypothetical protein MKUB_42890 [Mycobacterium kubicae]|uniref:Cytochrome C oxidase subunit IV family protein n=1 Tax=Mycobacterium kubicae TaxID=120959 RepID=A0AAX1J7G2_9MYCO|nr:cytochrome C oxidase subunit IV family protein [Mycobacterium kubicae]MCV7096300.1 cytochrome C oxidase subunit IV family protein [Mycobacterium kubicae]OBF18779.1 hypothetical protein A5725_01990 [Mycobacterium kubicae]OBK53011.1 hypothetical protein A5657_15815 [Mycobacterium kubicae]ORV95516.1 hypothetical protein AWC13_19875 [Mycobacterium kubicae]QNI13607.1 cytochrome C oxidase subunit IV family protein [Mycobacterium kubicae]